MQSDSRLNRCQRQCYPGGQCHGTTCARLTHTPFQSRLKFWQWLFSAVSNSYAADSREKIPLITLE